MGTIKRRITLNVLLQLRLRNKYIFMPHVCGSKTWLLLGRIQKVRVGLGYLIFTFDKAEASSGIDVTGYNIPKYEFRLDPNAHIEIWEHHEYVAFQAEMMAGRVPWVDGGDYADNRGNGSDAAPPADQPAGIPD